MNRVFTLALTVLLPAADAGAQSDSSLPKFETRYYIIHSPLDRDTLREAAVRIDRMAETYYDRTRGFAGEIRSRMPLYLFDRLADYHAAGETRIGRCVRRAAADGGAGRGAAQRPVVHRSA